MERLSDLVVGASRRHEPRYLGFGGAEPSGRNASATADSPQLATGSLRPEARFGYLEARKRLLEYFAGRALAPLPA